MTDTLDKPELRRLFLKKRHEIATPDKDAKIRQNIIHYLNSRGIDCIGAYYPIGSEIDLRPIFSEFKVALPAFYTSSDMMTYHEYLGEYSLELHPDFKKFYQPKPDSPLLRPKIILVPLLAFDRSNHRLGYGKGHFDRFITKNPDLFYIGVAYSEQKIDSLPFEPHDRPLDLVISEV